MKKYIKDIEQKIYYKFAKYLDREKPMVDIFGNLCYITNGIKVVKVIEEKNNYKWDGEYRFYKKGYYVLSTHKNNYIHITDYELKRFILFFNLKERVLVKEREGMFIHKPTSLREKAINKFGVKINDLF